MKDSEILDRIARGDEKVLDHLYKKFYRMMIRIVLTNNGSEDEAKDIFQDALIVFWQKAASGNLILTSKISTYIYSICQNLWRKELDRKMRFSDQQESTEIVFQDYERSERNKIVRECIEELGESCKKILTYYYFDGLSMNDIAKKLDLANTDTAKTKKYKCKKRLDSLVKAKYTPKDFLD